MVEHILFYYIFALKEFFLNRFLLVFFDLFFLFVFNSNLDLKFWDQY